MVVDALHTELLGLAAELGKPMLALDTSAASSSLCVVSPQRGVVSESTPSSASLPAESIVSEIVRVLHDLGISASDLGLMVIGLGPGSFTGLRVGLATLKGLGYGASIPVFGTSSLALLAAAAGAGLVAPVLDARREEVYGALYRVSTSGASPVMDDRLTTPAAFAAALQHQEDVVLVGDYAARLRELGVPAAVRHVTPRAAFGFLHERQRIVAGLADDLFTLTPRYLKVSEAERKA